MRTKIVYTQQEVHPDVYQWLVEGSSITSGNDVKLFLTHLLAMREVRNLDVDGVIILERGAIVHPDFNTRIHQVLESIPQGIDICLLSHLVTDWTGINYIKGDDKKIFRNVTGNVHGSFGYWIRMSHLNHLLSLFDYPLRSILMFDVSPETLTRYGNNKCMVREPLIARMYDEGTRTYFKPYGF